MAVPVERAADEAIRTSKGRLYEWSYARHWPDINVWPPESAMYAVLHNPGRATNTKSDGGLSALVERRTEAMDKWDRTLRTSQAIAAMPSDYRKVVYAMYRVEQRERPRRLEHAAEVAGMPIATFRKAMDFALVWLQGRLDLDAIRGPNDSTVDNG
jgi:hypothetical protein